MTDHLSKIAVIGDIHAEHERLEALIHFFQSQQPDKIFSVGDIVDGPGSVDRCCELLIENNIATTLGNHEVWCLENSSRGVEHATLFDELGDVAREFLQSLPRTLSFETPAGKAMVCHGLGENNMAAVRRTDSMDDIFNNLDLWAMYKTPNLKFILNGHSHRPNVHVFNHLTVINSGALCEEAEASAVLVDFKTGTANFYVTDNNAEVKLHMTKEFAVE